MSSQEKEDKIYECRYTADLHEAEKWQSEGFKPHTIFHGKIFMRRLRRDRECNCNMCRDGYS